MKKGGEGGKEGEEKKEREKGVVFFKEQKLNEFWLFSILAFS